MLVSYEVFCWTSNFHCVFSLRMIFHSHDSTWQLRAGTKSVLIFHEENCLLRRYRWLFYGYQRYQLLSDPANLIQDASKTHTHTHTHTHTYIFFTNYTSQTRHLDIIFSLFFLLNDRSNKSWRLVNSTFKNWNLGWRDGSEGKSTDCSSKGPEFKSQKSHGGSQPSLMRSDALFWVSEDSYSVLRYNNKETFKNFYLFHVCEYTVAVHR